MSTLGPFRRLLAALVAALALVVVPASASIFSGFKNSLIEFALGQISVPNTLEIAAERIEDPEEGFVRLVGVTIEDREGVWMRIGELMVDWNVSRILRGELELGSLLARDVEVLRVPNQEDVAVEVKEGSALDRSLGSIFDWPRSPIDTRVERMTLENVFIAEGIIANQSLRFEAEGSARDEGAIQAVALEVFRTDEVAGAIEFDYERDFDENTLALLLQAAEEPGGLVADIFGLPNDATSAVVIDADGPLTEWQLDFAAETVGIYEAGGEAVVSTDAPFTVAADFFVAPGPNMSPELRQVLGSRSTLDLRLAETEPGRIAVEEAAIRGPDISLDASGAYLQTTGELDFSVDLAVEEGLAAAVEGVELGRFTFDGDVAGTLDDLTASGALRLSRLRTAAVEVDDASLQATVEVAGQRIAADVEGEVGGIRLDRLTREQLGTARIDGAFVYDQQTLTLEDFSIASPLLDVGVTGTVDTATSRADVSYKLATDRLGVIATAYEVDAAGALEVSGTLSGPFAAPRLAGDATFGDLVYQGTDYGRVTIRHDVSLGEEPQGTVDVVASGSPYGPAEVKTTFALPTDGTLRLTEMTANALGVTAEGRATVDLGTTLVSGTLDIAAEDLSRAGDELDLAVGGGATGRVVLEVEDGRQMARANLTLDGFSGPGVTIGAGSMAVAVADALGDPRIDLDLDASDVTGQGVIIGSVKGTLTSREDEDVADVALTLVDVEGYDSRAPSARVEGTVTDPFGAPQVDLALEVESIDGAIISGPIGGTVETTPGPGRVDLVITAADFAAYGASTDRAVIDATVDGIDTPGPMTIATDLTLDGLAYQQVRLGRFVGRVETTDALEAVRIDARLTGVAGEDGLSVATARLNGVINDPLEQPKANVDLVVEDLAYRDDRLGRLAGRVEMPGTGDVLDLGITATDFSVAGVAGTEAVVDGTVRDPFGGTPRIDAELTVDGLAYQDIRMGRLAGTVDSNEDGSRMAVDLSLSGVEGDGLTVDAAEVTGTVIDPFGLPAVDADLTVRALAYRDVTLSALTGQVRTTPEKDRITLDVTLDALDSQGVHIDRALIDGVIRDPFGQPKPTAELVVEGLAYEGEPVGTVRGTVETSDDGQRIAVDIRLEGTGEGTGAGRAEIVATVRTPYTQPLVDADIDITDFRFGDLVRIERMDGTVETTGEAEAIAIDLDLAGLEGAGVRVDRAAVVGRVADPFGEPAVEAQIDADGLAYGDEVRVGSIDGAVSSLDGLNRIAVDMRASAFAGFGVRFDTASVEGVALDPLGEPGFEGEVAAVAFAYQDALTVARIAGKIAAEPGLELVELDAGFESLDGYGASVGAGQVNGVITNVTTGEPGFEGEFGIERLGYADELSIERLSGNAAGDNVLERAEIDLNIDGLEGYGVSMASGDIAGTVIDPTGVPRFDGEARARQIRYGDYRIERVAAEADVTEGGERVEITAELSSLSGGGASVDAARLDALVTNATSDPVIEAVLQARGAGFQGNEAAELRAEATVTGVASGSPSVTGQATASGVSAGGARIGGLDLSYDVADVAGALSGTVSGTLRSISSGGISAARADLDARLTASGGATNVDAGLSVANVNTGTGTIDRVTVDATVRDALGGNPRLSVRGESSAADLGFARLQGLGLAAEGPLSALDVAISTAGERVLYDRVTEPLGLEARATLNLTGGLGGRITTLDLVSGEDRVRLSSPLTFRTAGGVTTLEDVALDIPGGTLAADLAIHPGGLVGDIGLIVTDPRPLARLTPLPQMSGRIELAADFDTRPGRAGATAALDATELRFADVYQDFGTLAVDLDMTWDGSAARIAVDVTGPFDRPVVARLAVPLRPTGGLVPAVPENAPLDGSLSWAGDIGTIWPLVPLSDHVLDGPVDVDLRVSGPIGGPEVSGNVSMTGGQYQNLDFGTILTDLNVRSQVQPGGSFALDLTASDAADARITGRVTLGPGGIDANLRAEDAILVRRDDLTAALDADVTIRGPLDAFTVAGRMEIERAEARLVDVTPPSVITLGDVRIKGRREPPPKPSRASFIRLDLSIVAENGIFVRGRGLDSEWEAELNIGGTAASPRITGYVQRIRGELALLGRRFRLENGLVDFAGLDPINPALDIRLTREADEVTGGIWLHGRARDIEIDFFSSPALPEEEVLPRVLFGRSRQSLSPIEAVQLAAGVATVLDGTGGTIDQIRGALGVDVLRFEGGTGDTGPAVSVGRNIADNVFVGVQQPVGGGEPSVEVEIEVFNNFEVESKAGGATGSSVGIQWKKDF